MYLLRTTVDNKKLAKTIADVIVREHLAVCAHIREVFSTYAWSEEIISEDEWEVEFITHNTEDLSERIIELHNYVTPEILITKVRASNDIQDWVSNWGDTADEVSVDELL